MTPPPAAPREQITGVVLAGGRATRMGGMDKGLVPVAGRPMVAHVLDALAPQVGALVINANRNHERYAEFGHPVVSDRVGDFAGPLAGMAAALETARTPWVVFAPCDSPRVPGDLVDRLYDALVRDDAEIAASHDGQRLQPVFVLIRRELADSLNTYLDEGERKIDRWFARHRLAQADFSDCPEAFANINDEDELAALEARLAVAGDRT
jgi:molybdenum cofactor guanylyltransferase